MKIYNIEFSNLAAKELEAIYKKDRKTYDRIVTAIESLSANPFQGKKLKGKLKGDYSIHIGSYRAVYSVLKAILLVHIIDIGHRREIYRVT